MQYLSTGCLEIPKPLDNGGLNPKAKHGHVHVWVAGEWPVVPFWELL